jgi:hypothetical protein
MELMCHYLAKAVTYHSANKICGYDLHMCQGPLWGERFPQCQLEEGQTIG